MLATEDTHDPAEAPVTQKPILETWSDNERMRHIPDVQSIVQKLDGDVRKRIDKLYAVYAALPGDDPRHAPIEQELRALCRAIDLVADIARRPRGNTSAPHELGQRIQWAINHAVGNLTGSDAHTFGRRLPFQTFERSNAEPLWAAMLRVIQHVQRLVPLIREIDPGIDERLYEGLVVLHEPLRREPIA
ncbi:MAG TPA: hypothetical protein VF824_02980 [Thermoanaerobaculia bacterium]|jgi:hypothetical protein